MANVQHLLVSYKHKQTKHWNSLIKNSTHEMVKRPKEWANLKNDVPFVVVVVISVVVIVVVVVVFLNSIGITFQQ